MININSINEVLKLLATETGALVTTEGGDCIDLTVPGEENIVLSLPITHECEHVEELMNADHIKLSFSSTVGVTIPIGSYVVWNGITYRLTKPYTPTRKNEIEYRYEPEFQSKVMGWAIKPLFFLTKSGGVVVSRETDWQLTGTPTDFLNAVKDSILDETGETYTFSIASGLSGSKTLSFESTDILSALNSIAETFETEWWVDGTVIYLGDCSIGTAITLETSVDVSVPEVTKSDKGYFTRFYAFGSTRNIVQDYTAGTSTNYVVGKRLSLPASTCPNGYKDIRAGLTTPEIASKSLIFDDIYPRSNLSISDIRVEEKFRVDAGGSKIQIGIDPETEDPIYETYNIYFFKVPGFLFDPDTIIEGKTLSVHFNSGYLLDMEFELAYHESEVVEEKGYGEFEIIIDESTGSIIPNSILSPVNGDLIVLFNIELPQEYIDSAKAELEGALDAEMAEYLSDNDTYKVNSNPVKFQTAGISLGIGSNVTFINGNTSLSSRVIAITEKLDFPAQKVITIGKSKRVGTISQLKESVKKVENNENVLEGLQKQATSNTRRMFRDAKETIELLNKALLNYTGSINPITVQTMALLVGDESLQFRFVDSKTAPVTVGYTIAYDPETKILSAPVGIIQHMTLGISSISSSHAVNEYKFWDIPLFESAELIDGTKSYYLYARVSSSDQTGALLLSETAIALSGEAGYYHLLVGILNSEYEKDRSFVTLYGFTEILPGRITTDNIQSSNYTDDNTNTGSKYGLSDGTIRVGNNQHGFTYAPGDGMKLYDPLVVNPGGTEFPVGVYRGAYDPLLVYYKGDEVTRFGSTWIFINNTPTAGQAPVEGAYWSIKSAKGEDGTTLYTWIKYADDASGTGMSDDPTGKLYIGIAHNKTTATESTNPADYTWSLIKGSDGDPGSNAPYWEYRYAKNGSTTVPPSIVVTDREPTGWTTTIPTVGVLEYLWTTRTLVTYDGVSLVQNWSDPARLTGVPGQTGDQGPIGPSPVYQGLWVQDAGKTYYGTTIRVDIVQYSGTYYVARTDAGTFTDTAANIPTNTAKWNTFGAQFTSVATDLLFAQLAYIENLGVGNVRTGTVGGARLEISQENGAYYLKVYDTSNNERIKIAAGIFEVKQDINRFLRMNETSTTLMALRADGGTGISIYTQDTTGKGIGITAQTGGKAIESYGNHILSARSTEQIQLLGNVLVEGLNTGVIRTDASTTYLGNDDTYFEYFGTGNASVYLSSAPTRGKIFFVKRTTGVTLTVYGNGNYIRGYGLSDTLQWNTADVDMLYMFYWNDFKYMLNVISR